MDCEKFFELMNERLDGIISEQDDAALSAHLAECEQCRELYAELAAVQAEMGDMLVEPPQELCSGIMYKVGLESGRGRKKRFVFGRFTAIAAAAVVVILIAVYALPNFKNSAKSAETANIADMEYASSDLAVPAELRDTASGAAEAESAADDSAVACEEAPAEPAPEAAQPAADKSEYEDEASSDGAGNSITMMVPSAAAAPALPYSQAFSAILVYNGAIPAELDAYPKEAGAETECYIFVPSAEAQALIDSGEYDVYLEGVNISPDAEQAIVVIYGEAADAQ